MKLIINEQKKKKYYTMFVKCNKKTKQKIKSIYINTYTYMNE